MKPEIVIASDFHISPEKESPIVPVICAFIEKRVLGAGAFYILGDLFDYWTGRDAHGERVLAPLFEALRSLVRSGTEIYLIHGNRDFLLTPREALRFGVAGAIESVELTLDSRRYVLTHGDCFCTRDRSYQRMKRFLRFPLTRFGVKLVPGGFSMWMARKLRQHSERVKKKKPASYTSLEDKEIEKLFSEGVDTVICGHVHKAEDRLFPCGGRLVTLSDWSDEGGWHAEYRDKKLFLRRFSMNEE